jgi:hypothetical protein
VDGSSSGVTDAMVDDVTDTTDPATQAQGYNSGTLLEVSSVHKSTLIAVQAVDLVLQLFAGSALDTCTVP